MSDASSVTAHPAALDGKPLSAHTLRRFPWRPHVTPFETIFNHPYKGSGTDADPYIIDWLPEDPEDPQGWSQLWKWSQIVVASFATLAVALSSSAYTGGIPSLMQDFQKPSTLFWTGGVSLFVLGFAFGPLLWAPASEVFGRRNVYLVSYFFLTLWQAVTCAAPNPGSVLVFRGLAGLFGSSPLANAGGTIADVLDPTQMGLGMALFSVAPFLGPAIGPITGGFLGQAAGWRWVMGMLALFCGAVFVLLFLFSAETYAPLLLRQRAAKLSKITGKVYRYRADAAKPFNIVNLFKASLIRPWKFLVFEPIVLILSIYVAIIYGILYLNFAAYPIVFSQGHGWSTGISGLAFLGIMIGAILSVIVTIVWTNPRYIKTIKKRGYPVPEDRLTPAMWGGIVIIIGLAGFAATDGPDVHWIAPIIFGIPFGMGMVVLFLSCMGYLVDVYVIYAASVLAANSVLRSLFGAAFPLFTKPMYEKLGVHWAAALPGFLALLCAPFPFLFYKYGGAIREKCKYASEAAKIYAQILAARKAAAAQAPGADPEKNVRGANAEADDDIQSEAGFNSPELFDLQRTISMEEELNDPRVRQHYTREYYMLRYRQLF
jgi:MFS family permease